MAKGRAGGNRCDAPFWAHGVRFSASDGARDGAQDGAHGASDEARDGTPDDAAAKVPPMRKNAPALLTERPFERGGTGYLRRDYEDGTVDLIYFDGARGAWVYEIYRRYPVAGMDYDFEDCLASPLFFMRYLAAIAVR